MSPLLPRAGKIALLSAFFLQKVWSEKCDTFGVDFQVDGSYFQNSLSTDNFTFVSRFEGCQNTFAQNFLYEPSGNSVPCSNTDTQPDDTPELSTCEIQKKDLVSGEYSLHILGNNGDGDPFSYQRDISLLVGPQQTTTYTPTVTVQSTLIPIVNSTSTNTYVSTTTLAPATVTQPSTTLHPSTTITPAKVTSTTTSTLGTITLVEYTVPISQVVVTSTATCITPTKQEIPDPTCTTAPFLAAAAPLETPASAKFRRLAIDRAQRIQERKERLGEMQKRSPDSATITVTDLNTDDYFTTTTTVTGPATTLTIVSTSTIFTTETPAPMTVFSGVSTASTITITAPTPTKTRTVYTNAVALITSTRVKTVTVTTIITPSASLAACAQIGGIMN